MMIRFDNGDNRFNYRIAGVAVHDGSVLLHQAEGDNFWAFPGGRAEFGEPAEQTLIREMREEIGVEIEVVRALWFVENFFSCAERRYHEVSVYFLMRLPPNCRYLTGRGPFLAYEETGTSLIFQWFPNTPETLRSLPLLPSFLQTAIQELPQTTSHIVQDDWRNP